MNACRPTRTQCSCSHVIALPSLPRTRIASVSRHCLSYNLWNHGKGATAASGRQTMWCWIDWCALVISLLRMEDVNQVSSATWVIRRNMPAMGIMIGRRASEVFEELMRVVFVRVSVDSGVPDGEAGRSSILLSVGGETEIDGLKVALGAADAAGRTQLRNSKYNMDMYIRRGYILLRPHPCRKLHLSAAAS